jgi:hypothetical protein
MEAAAITRTEDMPSAFRYEKEENENDESLKLYDEE